MKKFAAAVFFIVIGGAMSDDACALDRLVFLQGEWSGEGETSGLVSSIAHSWTLALNDEYMTVNIRNRMMREDGQEVVFEGIGYYRASDGQTFSGVWIDTQGDILPLRATVEDQVLTATWGTADTKFGRSVYRLLPNGTLEVINSISNENGEWQEFGRSILSRDRLRRRAVSLLLSAVLTVV